MADEKTLKPQGRLYGRAWKINIYQKIYTEEKVTKANGNIETIKKEDKDNIIVTDVSTLRCTFNIQQTNNNSSAICNFSIYNMNAETEARTICAGFMLSIEAGYESGQYGEIFTGEILQVIRNKENGVDCNLQIVAMKGMSLFDANYVRTVLAAGSKPRNIAEAVCSRARQPIELDAVSDNLSNQQLARGKVLFGTPAKYLRDVSIGNNAYYWMTNNEKLTMKKPSDKIPNDHCLVLSPGNPNKNEPNMGGMIGVPQYEDNGIKIKMLLEPRISLLSLVKIDNEWINKKMISIDQKKKIQEQKNQQKVFDEDGEYQVCSIVHKGDTHGNDWYTEVLGVNRLGQEEKKKDENTER